MRKEGIEVVRKLNTLNVNLIAQKITNMLCAAFPEHGLSCDDIFSSLARLNMYHAKMNDHLCGAKYYYKNNSIYFNIDYPLERTLPFALHECIHFLQEQKDEKGNLTRLGIYDFLANHGMAINEAAVQLMTATALNMPVQNVTYYGIEIPTSSIDCYPLECVIVNQMAYFTGTYPLFHSVLNGNDIFKNTFITLSSQKAYDEIDANLEKMIALENNLAIYFEELKHSENNIKTVRKLNSIISETKEEIKELFFKCQNTIIAHCFSHDLNNLRSIDDIKMLKNKIYNFQSHIATSSGYEFYNEFYRRMMEALDEKTIYFETHGSNELVVTSTSLSVIDKAKGIFAIFRKILNKLGLVRQGDF